MASGRLRVTDTMATSTPSSYIGGVEVHLARAAGHDHPHPRFGIGGGDEGVQHRPFDGGAGRQPQREALRRPFQSVEVVRQGEQTSMYGADSLVHTIAVQ